MTRKNQRSQIFCSGVKPPETDIVLPLPIGGSKGRLEIESELAGGHEEVKTTFED